MAVTCNVTQQQGSRLRRTNPKYSKADNGTAQQLQHEKLYLDERVIASGDNDIRAVFGIAYSIHIISMRPHSHSGLQAPTSV